MNRSEIKRLQKVSARLNELSGQYKALQQPASIHFTEVAEDVDKILSSPVMANEGDVTNLSTLQQQLKDELHKHGIELKELTFDIIKGTFYVVLKRLFLKPNDTYSRDTETFYSVKPEKLITEISEWCVKHHQEAGEQGVTPETSPDTVINNQDEKEVSHE